MSTLRSVTISFTSLKGFQKDLFFSVFFGSLSAVLRFVQFRLPGYEDISSDLRDIPLLIAIFHIRSPIIVVAFGFFTLLSAPHVPLFSEQALIYALPHVVGLLFAWYAFGIIKKVKKPDWLPATYWSMVVLVYFYFFLITAAAFYHVHTNSQVEESVAKVYTSIIKSTPLEVIATTLVTSLYLVQMNSKSALAHQNDNLENILKLRTAEVQSSNEKLMQLNEELMSSSEKIRSANNNLENMVRERTKKINDQLWQLSRYAHMNSHDVRAPLARIMGLAHLLEREVDPPVRDEIIKKLWASSKELDGVINSMTLLLTKEIPEEIQESKS